MAVQAEHQVNPGTKARQDEVGLEGVHAQGKAGGLPGDLQCWGDLGGPGIQRKAQVDHIRTLLLVVAHFLDQIFRG
ncbi:Uncharacterised protein [uncultured archaeon]|nr:Uncharacterised protein [uncultured archaeon]